MRSIILILLLASCATTAGYRRMMDGWKGRTADELVMSWGPPHDQYTLISGHVVFAYDHHSTDVYVVPGNPYTGAYGISANRRWCSTLFLIDPKGTIVEATFRGNDCRR